MIVMHSFESHISSLCKKANQKLHTLERIANYTDLEKNRYLTKAQLINTSLPGCFTPGTLIKKQDKRTNIEDSLPEQQ